MTALEAFLAAYGLLAICLVLLVKSCGIPVPIPGDALLLAAAARAAQGHLVLWQAFVALLGAMLAGRVVQFSLARGPGRGVLERFGPALGLTPARLDRAVGAVRSAGPLGIGLALLTPGVQIATIAACGLANLSLRAFLPGLLLGTTADLALHFALGYLGGALLDALPAALPPPLLVLVALLAAGLAAWVVIRRRQRPGASRAEVLGAAVQGWAEATCPACLVLVGASRFEPAPLAAPTPRDRPAIRPS